MPTLDIIGSLLVFYAGVRYGQLWMALIFSRQHSPQIRAGFIIPMMLGGTVGTSILLWEQIPWWFVGIIYLGIAVLVLIPVVLFRAR